MSNPERIEVGDTVRVTFVNTGHDINGTVQQMPRDVGDCWSILTSEGPVNIMLFESMRLISKPKSVVSSA